jgi:hypothetical protein
MARSSVEPASMCARSATSSRKPAASSLQGAVAAGVAAVAIAALAANLPADGFYSGDSGVKLIATLNAIGHPAAPFDIDLPRIAGQPVRYVERFFELHGDHAHALQSPVFPLLTAPFVAMAGLRGAYILPAICFIALAPLLLLVRREYASQVPPWIVAIVAVAANPVFFYALELWEHVPAIMLLAVATAFIRTRPTPAGVAAGIAVLLRPEAAWYAAGLVVMTGNMPAYAIGGAVALAPFGIYNLIHSGNVLGPHAAANLAPLTDHWLRARGERMSLWLMPSSPMAVIGFALIAVAQAARYAGRSLGVRQVFALSGALVITFAAVTDRINRESLWCAWPLATLLLVPGAWPRTKLWTPVLVSTAAVLLLSTHDGGAQWGPRFLLIASPALIVLVCDAIGRVLDRSGAWFTARAALVALLVLSAVYTSRNAYRELRGTKQFYARVNAATLRVVPPGGYVISRVWWFDQITAPLYRRHTVLSVDDDAEERAVLQQLENAQVRSAMLVISDEEGERSGPAQTAGTCYRAAGERRIEERRLRYVELICAR